MNRENIVIFVVVAEEIKAIKKNIQPNQQRKLETSENETMNFE